MQTNIQPSKANTTQVFFMPSLFKETMQLLTEARDYFAIYGDDDQMRVDEAMRSIYSSEMSRITLRLSTIMAWTMAQRAVISGQITQEDAASHHQLGFQDVCRVDSSVLHGMLPDYVCHLLDRSYELYERVVRLDDQFRRAV